MPYILEITQQSGTIHVVWQLLLCSPMYCSLLFTRDFLRNACNDLLDILSCGKNQLLSNIYAMRVVLLVFMSFQFEC